MGFTSPSFSSKLIPHRQTPNTKPQTRRDLIAELLEGRLDHLVSAHSVFEPLLVSLSLELKPLHTIEGVRRTAVGHALLVLQVYKVFIWSAGMSYVSNALGYRFPRPERIRLVGGDVNDALRHISPRLSSVLHDRPMCVAHVACGQAQRRITI